MAHDEYLGGLLERALERRLEHVVALLELIARGRLARLGREEVGVRRRVPRCSESLVYQQHLDAALVQRPERVGQPGGATGVPPELALQAIEPLALLRLLVRLDDRGCLARD